MLPGLYYICLHYWFAFNDRLLPRLAEYMRPIHGRIALPLGLPSVLWSLMSLIPPYPLHCRVAQPASPFATYARLQVTFELFRLNDEWRIDGIDRERHREQEGRDEHVDGHLKRGPWILCVR